MLSPLSLCVSERYLSFIIAVLPLISQRRIVETKSCFSYWKDLVVTSYWTGKSDPKLFCVDACSCVLNATEMTSFQGFLICVSWLVIGSYSSSAVEVSMEGTGYITYDLRSDSIATEINHITFAFKTFRPSGLLLHSSGSQGDFITIELVHGRLR